MTSVQFLFGWPRDYCFSTHSFEAVLYFMWQLHQWATDIVNMAAKLQILGMWRNSHSTNPNFDKLCHIPSRYVSVILSWIITCRSAWLLCLMTLIISTGKRVHAIATVTQLCTVTLYQQLVGEASKDIGCLDYRQDATACSMQHASFSCCHCEY